MERRNQGPLRASCFDPELHKESCQNLEKELGFLHPTFLHEVKISAFIQTKMPASLPVYKEANGQFMFLGTLSRKDPVCRHCVRV